MIWNPRVIRGDEMVHVQYGERVHQMQPVRDLIATGLAVHLEGGDPEEPPMWRIERFVTRSDRFETRTERRRTGVKPAAPRIWGADQTVDRRQALRMVTIDAARFISEERMLGSIERGKYADLVVLSGNFLNVPDDQLGQLEPVMTIVGGNVAYEATGR
jgi:predicted amidohydrolase YtcJ